MPIERAPERSGAEPSLLPGEEVRRVERRTKLYFNDTFEGEGDLYLSTKRIIWLDVQNADHGFAMDYPFVTLHALSTDTSQFHSPCLYCQLKSEEAEETDDVDTQEVRFVPAAAETLHGIFTVF